MPRTYGRLQGIKLKDGWNKTIDDQLQIIVKHGARAYIRALIARVPVWTGMARGSIKFASGPGGSLGAYLNIAIPIVPHQNARITGRKNARVGGRFGRYNFTGSNHVYRFKFRSDVIHYILNEFFARPSGIRQQITAPWYSQFIAAHAFRTEITARLKKLPKVKSFLVKVNIPFGQ